MLKETFVFGSNLAGKHDKGAAITAMQQYGAKYGQGIGKQGNSYAIPTKDENIQTLPLDTISIYVKDFIQYVKDNPDERFLLTRVGCGLAGYSDNEIAPLFKCVPYNVSIPDCWKDYI